jgi:endonuclease/exonuclease/phosphatase (EEP) superfamily protein YafD
LQQRGETLCFRRLLLLVAVEAAVLVAIQQHHQLAVLAVVVVVLLVVVLRGHQAKVALEAHTLARLPNTAAAVAGQAVWGLTA